MNRTVLILGSFFAGATVGFLVSKQMLDRKYEARYQEEIESVKEAFAKAIDEEQYEEMVDDYAKEDLPPSDFRTVPSHLVRSSLEANKPNKSELAKKDYQFHKPAAGAIIVKPEPPKPETDEEEEEETTGSPTPYPISDQQYLEECDHFTKLSLIYYQDGALMTEEEEMIDDIAHTIGHVAFSMLTTGMRGPLWARNELTETDFEIIVMQQPYGEMMDTPEQGSMRRRNNHDEDDED